MTAKIEDTCPDHCKREQTRLDADNKDQWKALNVLRESVYRRPSWYTTAIISFLIGICGYLYARLDDARGIDVRVTVQLGKVETRLESVERQLAILTSQSVGHGARP
jgi:hypothetical protein